MASPHRTRRVVDDPDYGDAICDVRVRCAGGSAREWDVVWRNFVHERFQNWNSPADTRQRHLALDFGDGGDWIEVGRITELTPRLANAYAGKTPKKVQRDLNALVEMGLVARDGRKVRARREVILAFLPLRRKAGQAAKTG